MSDLTGTKMPIQTRDDEDGVPICCVITRQAIGRMLMFRAAIRQLSNTDQARRWNYQHSSCWKPSSTFWKMVSSGAIDTFPLNAQGCRAEHSCWESSTVAFPTLRRKSYRFEGSSHWSAQPTWTPRTLPVMRGFRIVTVTTLNRLSVKIAVLFSSGDSDEITNNILRRRRIGTWPDSPTPQDHWMKR